MVNMITINRMAANHAVSELPARSNIQAKTYHSFYSTFFKQTFNPLIPACFWTLRDLSLPLKI